MCGIFFVWVRWKREPGFILQVHIIVIPVVFQSIFRPPPFPRSYSVLWEMTLGGKYKKNPYTSFFKMVYSYVGFAFAYFSVTDFNHINNSHVSRLSSRRHLLLHCQICLFISWSWWSGETRGEKSSYCPDEGMDTRKEEYFMLKRMGAQRKITTEKKQQRGKTYV